VLVGIDRYPDPAQELHGCVNDVFQVSAALQESGYEPDEIRVLTDERANAAAIRGRLDWLLAGTKPGDRRFFYFSGHGAQMPGYGASAEVDRLDETLVPVDFDWSLATAITDDDLYELYSQLPYDAWFVAAFDCCHSGGLARASANRVRGIDPPDDVRHRGLRWDARREMFVPRDLGDGGEDDGRRRIGHARDLRRMARPDSEKVRAELGHRGPFMPLIIQACREEEFSYEYTHGVTSYGAFTYAFTATLRRLRHQGKTPTFVELVEETGRVLAELGYEQHPQIEGPREFRSRPIPFTTAPRQGAQQEARALLAGELESAADLDARMARLLAIAQEHPDALDLSPKEALGRAADDAGDMKQTLAARWGIRWDAVQRPESAGEILTLLDSALRAGRSVRVVGAARSLSEVSNPSHLRDRDVVPLSLIGLSQQMPFEAQAGFDWHAPRVSAHWAALNPGRALYRCGAGRSVRNVLDDLVRVRRCLANHGSGSFQGVVGALATGTHGSGAALPPLAGLVRALTVAVPRLDGAARLELILPASPDRKAFELADGQVLRLRDLDGRAVPVTVRADDATFDAHTIGLGCLGVVHSVVLEVLDSLPLLTERRTLHRWSDLRPRLAELAHAHRHAELQICPHAGHGKVDERDVPAGDHLVQLVTRDLSTAERPSGHRGAPLQIGRSDAARGILGGRIRAAMRDPRKLPGGLVCGLTLTAGHEYTDVLPEALLLELKFEGIGAEYAVPLSSAAAVADRILELAREHDGRARVVMESGASSAGLLALWERTPPLTAVVTLRFAAPDAALLSLSHGLSEPACIIEIGMLGAPAL
jgi:hypothetical protein